MNGGQAVHEWGCNLHAHCYYCQDDAGDTSQYCAAVVSYYGVIDLTVGGLNNYNLLNFFADRDFWCDASTHDSIRNGTFNATADWGWLSF